MTNIKRTVTIKLKPRQPRTLHSAFKYPLYLRVLRTLTDLSDEESFGEWLIIGVGLMVMFYHVVNGCSFL